MLSRNKSDLDFFILNYLSNNLSKKLTYHSINHTLDVRNEAVVIAKYYNLAQEKIRLIEIAALLHDIGYTNTYDKHEDSSVIISSKILNDFGFNPTEIEIINKMILATKIPQKPITLFEKIICDADLSYLGSEDFWIKSNQLYIEINNRKKLSIQEWNVLQIKFFNDHKYHTEYSINKRDVMKRSHLHKLLSLI